jgi:Domain of unknown function (DUF6777)
MAEEQSEGPQRRGPARWLILGLVALLVIGGVIAAVLIVGGDKNEAQAQTVRFQAPTAPGPDPFTKPSDVKGKKKVDVGSGPYGGTGSDLVCDRELLIRSLKARPDRLRAWARVRGVEPTYTAVARYIRKLKPTTLIVDTRVTNYSYVDGRAVGFQAILQAGTAVLVDDGGKVVARCRCGNPLSEPLYIPEATCYGCPPNYTPPKPCYGKTCYAPYPDPPDTCCRKTTPTTPKEPTGGTSTTPSTAENPSASWNRSTGTIGDAYVFLVDGFAPNSSIAFTLTRPSGVTEDYTIETDSSGRGQHDFPPTDSSTENGTYTGVARNPATGASASASTTYTNTESSGGGGGTDNGTTTDDGSGTDSGTQGEVPSCSDAGPGVPCTP